MLEAAGTRTEYTFCRVCANCCGLKLEVDGDGQIVSILGDREHPVTKGYACSKGRASGEMHRRADRILRPLKRRDDGSLAPISLDHALDEIAEKLETLIAQYGPHTVSAFLGTTGYFNVPATVMVMALLDAIGSRSFFSSFTIDCSSKAVTAGRLGTWGAGRQPWAGADVWMVFGNNPFVSLSSQAGLSFGNPAKVLKEEMARGMKLIVVDPRRTETARHATLFLQPHPGEDAAVVAGMLRIILTEGLADDEFCAQHVAGVGRLREAVEPFTPVEVERRSGVDAELLGEAARMFGGAGKRGCAGMATGLTMSPHSNLVDHLIETLNVVCGRYLRAGEQMPNLGPISPRVARHAEVRPPLRLWDRDDRRLGEFGLIPGVNPRGEVPCGILADEILRPGDGQIRAMFVEGGNPAVAIPDQRRVVEALKDLELLVSVEPFMSATARLSHYVIPPTLMYERADLPMVFMNEMRMPVPFAQYAEPIVDPPAGAEVIDEWYPYWALAQRMELSLSYCGVSLDSAEPPTTDELLRLTIRDGQVPFDEMVRHPHGKVFDELDPVTVQPASPGSDGRFEVMPDDVFAELSDYRSARPPDGYTHRLIVRRMREVMNSLDPGTPTPDHNPAFLHPDDMGELGVRAGDRIEIASDYAQIEGIVEPDATLRRGVVSMSHCFGGLPDEEQGAGSCTNLLVDARRHRQAINAMPTMSGLPVRIRPSRA
ncbi:MAG TPA: molybdopterin-dependent oxidoreductase [Solirubrobacteraceae bacterium]|nr:molybdopterin-dependent oxidoreductase [Solirubrobacteraceae bacterium]